jgi:arginyl-tRNA synthetase
MNLVNDIQAEIEQVIKKLWSGIELPEVIVTAPPNPEFGDYSSPVALTLAKMLGEKPENIANQIKGNLKKIHLVTEVTVTTPGFINFLIDYTKLATTLLKSKPMTTQKKKANLVIEHTSVNPNKAAHIGHLRNACLGDSLAKLMIGLGNKVEVQNYIDDLGVQVADSVVAFETFGDVQDNTPVDKWFWKIYADIAKKYEEEPELKKRREEVLHEMEKGESEVAKNIVERIVKAHLHTFARFDINYDVLAYEHDIMKNYLWDDVFETLKKKKLIHQATSGEHKGAWVVEYGDTERENKILVRSNGLPTYTAKDIAYQLWKFGQVKMKGYKRKLTSIDQVINVIDERQGYPQAVIKHILEGLNYKKEAQNSIHLSYGVVKLSEKSAKALDNSVAQDGVASMSGRSGIGVMVNDLLDTAIAMQIKNHNTKEDVARQIAVGSIRYYMLKTRPQREIVFDFDDALSTDGNTGIYLQYAYARANNILAKAGKSTKLALPDEMSPSEKALLKALSELDVYLDNAQREYDPSLLCDYAYLLASTFAKFYELNPVLKSEGSQKSFRLHLVTKYHKSLGQILSYLGVPTLEKI